MISLLKCVGSLSLKASVKGVGCENEMWPLFTDMAELDDSPAMGFLEMGSG